MASTVLETLTIRITADITDLRLKMAEAGAMVKSMGREISDAFSHHVALGDIIQAGITAPLALAATQASISARTIRTELAAIATMQRAALGNALTGPNGVGAGTTGALIIDGTGADTRARQAAIAARLTPDELAARQARLAALQDDRNRALGQYDGMIAAGIPGRQQAAAASQRAQARLDEELENQRRDEHDAEEHRRRQREEGGGARRRGFFNIGGETEERLGKAAFGVGKAARGVAGSGIAQALGLTAMGSLIGSLIPLVAELAAIIGGALAAALAVVLTPLGLVVAGFTALFALFAIANWENVRNFIDWFGKRWNEVLGERFQGIMKAATELVEAFGYAFEPALQALRGGGDEFEGVLKVLGETVIRVFDAIGAAIEGFIRVFADMVKLVGAIIRGDWSEAFKAFHKLVTDVFAGIVDVVTSLFPELKAAWDAAWPALRDWMGGGFKDFVDGIGRQVDRAVGFFRNLGRAKEGAQGSDELKGYAGEDDLTDDPANMNNAAPLSKTFKAAKNALSDFAKTAKTDLSEIGFIIGDEINRSLEDAIMYGAKLSDVMRNLGQVLLQLAFRKLVTEPLAEAMGSIFSGNGGKGGKSSGFDWGTVISGIAGAFGASGGGKMVDTGKLGKISLPASAMNVGDLAAPAAGMQYNDNRVMDFRGVDGAVVAKIQREMAMDRAQRQQQFTAFYSERQSRYGR